MGHKPMRATEFVDDYNTPLYEYKNNPPKIEPKKEEYDPELVKTIKDAAKATESVEPISWDELFVIHNIKP